VACDTTVRDICCRMITDKTCRSFFEKKYLEKADPWDFASSDYERSRYTTIVEALSDRRYTHTFEPGCSVGVLTEQLASISERVDAIDISPTAVKQACDRCAALSNVHISCGTLPDDIPPGGFDLVLFSEIGYYFEPGDLREVLATLLAHMQHGGTLLAAHWLGLSADHLLTGDAVHEVIDSVDGLDRVHSERHAGFRLDRWIWR
jgi:trans-aconitate methyltransferase